MQEQIEEATEEEEIIKKYMMEIDLLQKKINLDNKRLEKKNVDN